MDPFTPIFPNTDLIGDLADVSPYLRQSWMAARAAHEKATRYYSGDIFRERVEQVPGEDGGPLLYPVGINLVKMISLSMTDAAYGEWDDPHTVVLFKPASQGVPTAAEVAAAEYASNLLADSNAASMLWELEFDRNLYGAGVLKIIPDMSRKSRARWQKVPLDGFYPVFDPTDPDTLLEVYQVTQILPEQAQEMYGVKQEGQDPIVVTEHWTRWKYETRLNQTVIPMYSGVNPWGVIPFVFIPRMRTIDWWGEALVEDIYAPQDEMNMRLADAGEALNYHSHPVFWGTNLPREFNSKNFPLDPSAFWDLGRARMGQGDEPKVGLLSSANPVAPATFEYIKFLYDWTRTAASAPPIAFGEDNGGGQRSGVTLEIRLWPLLKAMRRSRSYLSAGIVQALKVTGEILKQKKFSDVPAGVAQELIDRKIVPTFNPILPRDQAALVDEVVKLLSTEPPAISLETAQMVLGRGLPEVDKIKDMLKFLDKRKAEELKNASALKEKEMKTAKELNPPAQSPDKPKGEEKSPEADGD